MNRQEFLRQLAQLLEDIPAAERQEALDYYNSYFDDAGPENEAAVIQELGGDPRIAAASLKAEFQSANTGRKNYGEYTESGYRDNRIPNSGQMPRPMHGREKQSGNHRESYKGGSRTTKTITVVLILILTRGIWLGLLGGLAGLVFGLLGGVLSLLVGMASLAIGLVVGGITLTVTAIVKCFTNLPLGLLGTGLGLVVLAAGILLLALFLWLTVNYVPKFVGWIYGWFMRFFHWCRRKWNEVKN